MQSSKLFRWLFVALVCVIALPAAARARAPSAAPAIARK